MKTDRSTRRDHAVLGVALVIILAALIVIVGWHAHLRRAVLLFHGSGLMQYNTALCFAALGVAGIGLATGQRRLLLWGGSFVAVMSTLVLLESASGTSFGIDTLFFYPWERTLSAAPGRMPVATAISLALAGVALVLLGCRQRAYGVFGIVSSVPLSLALTSLIGHVFQLDYALSVVDASRMSLHSAMALLAFEVVTVGHAWKHSERGPDGLPTWIAGISVSLLPVLFVGSSALFSAQSWQVVMVEALASVSGVILVALAIRKLTTARVAYKGLVMIAAPLTLLLTFVGLVAHLKSQSESAQAWSRHSTEVLGVSQTLLTELAETESAIRGFVITGDEAFRDSHDASQALTAMTSAELRRLVSDNSIQEARAVRIGQLTSGTNRFDEIFRLIRPGNQTPLQQGIEAATGPALMQEVRGELALFFREEARLEALRRQVLDASWQRLSWLLVAGTTGAILLASILMLSFTGSISRRFEQLRDNADSLAKGEALSPRLAGRDEIAELDRVFHRMAESLDELTKREKAVVEGATDGIVIKDLEHRYVMVNQGSAKMLGRTVEEVVGRTIFDLYEPDTAQRILAFDNEILAGGEARTHELRAATKGGDARIYSSTYLPYRSGLGALVGVISISRDITDQKRAEAALIDSERRFRELFYDAPVGYHELDTEGRITCVNTTELLMFGYSSEEMVGHYLWEFVDDSEAARHIFAEWLAGTTPMSSVEGSFRRRDGTYVAVQGDSRMLRDPDGRIAGFRVTVQDITERKQAEALIKAGALQSAIFTSANFSSIATDARGVIQIFNVGAERMLGYTAGDVTNRITPADISDSGELIARAGALSLELGTPILPGFEALVFKASRGIEDIYELTYIRKDGSRFPAVVSVTALRDAHDAIIGYLLIGTDNTARKQVEEERQKLDQRLRDQHFYTRSLIESNIDALVTTDPYGIITDVNRQMEALTGCTRDELIGAPFKSYVTDAGRAEAGIRRVLSEGRLTNYELTARARDGTETIVSFNATTFLDRDQRLQGVFAAARDMTEWKRFEQTLQQKNVELEEADRMKSEFLATMSHELRTPLNAIIGFSEVLRDGLMGELTDQQRGFIGDIFVSGKHLLALINDILDLSKVEAGKMTLELEPVPVSSLLRNSLSIVREKAAARHINVNMEGTENLGLIQADPRKVKQIVYNLLANAVKFSAEGGQVTLRAVRVPRAQVGRLAASANGRSFPLPHNEFAAFLEISVTDGGIGISPEGLERLFKPFSQVDGSLARRFEGTGLGLALVKVLTELHGGAVAVTSAPGHGSCFTVWLPERTSDDDAGGLAKTAAPPAIPPPVIARTALVVEDDLKAAELIRLQLEAEGFDVLHAASAELALTLAVQQPLSLITLDIMLPGMDGWELLGLLKQVPDVRRVPVVIMSIVADGNRGFAMGAAAVMQKPISRRQLYESLTDLGLLSPVRKRAVKILVVDDDPKAVELIAVRIQDMAGTVLRAFGGRDAIEAAREELPDLIVLDLMMPDTNGFEVVEALKSRPDTARIPILVVTAKQITAQDRATLNGYVTTIVDKAAFDSDRFTAEVRRAMSGRLVAA